MARAVEVLAVEQRQELGVREVVAPGELHQPRNRRDRRRVEEAELLLRAADAGVRVLEDGEEKPVLVTEVVIEHALVGGGAQRDPVDPRAAEPEAGKLPRGGVENARARALGVPDRSLPGGSPQAPPR